MIMVCDDDWKRLIGPNCTEENTVVHDGHYRNEDLLSGAFYREKVSLDNIVRR